LISKSNEEISKDFVIAQRIVNEVFYPQLEKNLETLNDHLQYKYGVRVGIEINWYFEKIEQ
jgi:hypothetical protein